MNTEALHIALQQSFSADGNIRQPAEEIIKNLKNIPGAPQMLLEIASEKQVCSMHFHYDNSLFIAM